MNDELKILNAFSSELQRYLNSEQLRELKEHVLSKIPTDLPKTDLKLDKTKVTEVEPYYSNLIRIQTDRIITYAENNLNIESFLNLLESLGKISISQGEFELASDIFNLILSKTKNNSKLQNLYAYALLSLSIISRNQALWEDSFKYTRTARKLFESQRDLRGLSKTELVQATNKTEQGKLESAKYCYEKAIHNLDTQMDKYIYAMIEANLGILNNMQGNFDEAYTYYRRALHKFEDFGDTHRISLSRHNLGMLFTHKKEFDSALNEFDISLRYSLKGRYLPNICMTYLAKAYVYAERNELEMAMAFSEKSLELSYQINDRISIADNYKVKGIIYRKQKKFELAKNYLLTSLRINTDLENKLNLAETSFELGVLYLEMNIKKEAKEMFENSMKHYNSINNNKEIDKILSYLEKCN
ncbi:hypothetical protein ACFLS9_07545 [Bacteroidota bacterium]